MVTAVTRNSIFFGLALCAWTVWHGSVRGQETKREPATIIVRVPASAKLFVEDVASSLTGPTRHLVTPPLEAGYKYSYTFRVEIVREGRPVTYSQKIYFSPGQAVTLDLTNPPADTAKGQVPGKKSAEVGFKLTTREKELLDLVNEQRQKAGLAALRANDKLFQAAREHTANMARQDSLEHTLDGKGPGERIRDKGYEGFGAGENIAAGQRTPAEAMDSWMNSPGHRANILGEDYNEIGIGIASHAQGMLYYTLVFAQGRGR